MSNVKRLSLAFLFCFTSLFLLMFIFFASVFADVFIGADDDSADEFTLFPAPELETDPGPHYWYYGDPGSLFPRTQAGPGEDNEGDLQPNDFNPLCICDFPDAESVHVDLVHYQDHYSPSGLRLSLSCGGSSFCDFLIPDETGVGGAALSGSDYESFSCDLPSTCDCLCLEITDGDWLQYDFISFVTQTLPTPTPTPTTTVPIIGNICNLENYSFEDGLEGWDYGDWVIWDEEGWVGLHGCTDQLDSYIAQTVELIATGPSDYYELTIMSRNFFPVPPGSEPLLRWKLNSQVPGDDPNWYQGQARIESVDYWQLNSFLLRPSNSPAISDTLTIWVSDREAKIDNVCITLHQGPATATPICPPEPTYTPYPTYTPLPTPTPATTATATAWAATATAWPTQPPYPTLPPPDCAAVSGGGNEPGWDFIWLMGQIIMFLGAFFEAVFQLLGTVLQPLFDFFGFIIWLAGATFSLVSSLIDLIASALQFLFSFVELFFNILEIIGAFIAALWNVLTMSPTDPGVEIPTYFGWGIAVWDFLIEGTPLEYLEPIAMAIASLLIIRWTVKQFSSWA